jgi:hypothetical protein
MRVNSMGAWSSKTTLILAAESAHYGEFSNLDCALSV